MRPDDAQFRSHGRKRPPAEPIAEDIRALLREAEAIRQNPASEYFFQQARNPLLSRFLQADNLN